MSAYKGESFGGMEVITGKNGVASEGFEKTVMFGKCACELNEKNPYIKREIAIRTCPGDIKKFEQAMRKEGVECDYSSYEQFRRHIFNRYKEADGFQLGLYSVAADSLA
jgi:hypothetical protein